MKTPNLKKNVIFAVLAVSLIGLSFNYSALTKKATDNVSAVKSNIFNSKTVSDRADLKKISLNNIEFDFDKASISPASYKELDRVVKLLKDNNASIKLAGHADSIGAYVYNWNLSKRRAQMVKKYLMDKGADASKIAATEFGDTKPIASNKTEEGRQKNRRVEMVFP